MSFVERLSAEGKETQQNHIEFSERLIAKAFLEVLKEENPEMEALYRKHIRQEMTPDELIGDMGSEADRKQRMDIQSVGGKFADAKREARKIAGVNEAVAIQEFEQDNTKGALEEISRFGDNLHLTLQAFKEAGLSSSQVEDIIEKSALMEVSLTGHPVNPRSSEYIKAVMDLDRVLENPDASYEDLKDVLRTMIHTPYTAVPKTSAGMTDEALEISGIIREASTKAYYELESALAKAGYGDVEIHSPLVKVNMWQGAGDGDGNPNATKEALAYGISASREAERIHQVTDLQKLAALAEDSGMNGFAAQFSAMATSLQQGEYAGYQQVVTQLQNQAENLTAVGQEDLADAVDATARRIERFKGRGALIDIRHGSEDVVPAATRIAEQAGLLRDIGDDAKAFTVNKDDDAATVTQKLDTQAKYMAEWLADEGASAKLQAVKVGNLQQGAGDDVGELAARIAGRMELIAENPDISDKFIVANTGHPAHILSAMLVAKSAGVKIAEEGATLNFVPLGESKAELEEFPEKLVRPLLENETFKAHVDAMGGEFTAMIAKSDTVRQDSMSAIYFQSEAAGRITLTAHEHDVNTHIFIGGGGSKARGGNRLSKNANAVASSVIHETLLEFNKENGRVPDDNELKKLLQDIEIGTALATVQGPDMQGKFSGVHVAEHTILTTVSENMLAAAQAKGLIPAPEIYGKDEQEREAIVEVKQLLRDSFQAGVDKYHDYLESGAIDKLGQDGYFPAVTNLSATTSLGNRPAKRGKKLPQEGMTPQEIGGGVSKGLVQNSRAIVVDRMLAHAGNYGTGYLGQDAVFETMLEKGKAIEEKYGHLFAEEGKADPTILELAYKIDPTVFGDFVRREAELTYMTDFEHNWRIGGKERPSDEEVRSLAGQFAMESKDNSAEVILAHFEMTALQVAGMVLQAARGITPEEFKAENGRDLEIEDAFRGLNPQVSELIERSERGREGEFARRTEEKLAAYYRENPNKPLSKSEFDEAVSSYAGAESPIGEGDVIARTSLRLHGRGVKMGSADLEEHLSLDVPSALQDYADRKGIPMPGSKPGIQRI